MYTLRTNNNNEHHFEREERARSVVKENKIKKVAVKMNYMLEIQGKCTTKRETTALKDRVYKRGDKGEHVYNNEKYCS